MAQKEEKENKEELQTSQQEKQFLVFSTRLHHDIRIACQQLDEGQGQADLTINQEVEAWLSK